MFGYEDFYIKQLIPLPEDKLVLEWIDSEEEVTGSFEYCPQSIYFLGLMKNKLTDSEEIQMVEYDHQNGFTIGFDGIIVDKRKCPKCGNYMYVKSLRTPFNSPIYFCPDCENKGGATDERLD